LELANPGENVPTTTRQQLGRHPLQQLLFPQLEPTTRVSCFLASSALLGPPWVPTLTPTFIPSPLSQVFSHFSSSPTSVGRVAHAFFERFSRFLRIVIYSIPAFQRCLICPIWPTESGDRAVFVFLSSLRGIGRSEASKTRLLSSFPSPTSAKQQACTVLYSLVPFTQLSTALHRAHSTGRRESVLLMYHPPLPLSIAVSIALISLVVVLQQSTLSSYPSFALSHFPTYPAVTTLSTLYSFWSSRSQLSSAAPTVTIRAAVLSLSAFSCFSTVHPFPSFSAHLANRSPSTLYSFRSPRSALSIGVLPTIIRAAALSLSAFYRINQVRTIDLQDVHSLSPTLLSPYLSACADDWGQS
jgi:hypothetical protein